MTKTPAPHDSPAYPSPAIVDSRRLMGANLYSAQPGVVIRVVLDDTGGEALIDGWLAYVGELRVALGWPTLDVHVRPEVKGATLFLAAPVDVLMTATEMNEQAWVAAEQGLLTRDVIDHLGMLAVAERASRARMATAYTGAIARAINVSFDDELLTLGSGARSQSWSLSSLPEELPWDVLGNVPVALVTGSNGKTTTTRLVAAMWRAAGFVAGWSCSDGVQVGDVQLESGDYSGPAGARAIVRDARVQAAVLETARGGILRRGLAVSHAEAAIITNISADHFGEYGVETLGDLAEVKRVVVQVLGANGTLVLNADDAQLVALAADVASRTAWFSARSDHAELDAHVVRGHAAATIHDGRMMLHARGITHDLGAVDDMPIALHGAAPYNVENLLGAALLASQLNIPLHAIRTTLASFGQLSSDNPGRLQVHHLGGVTVLVDYAHNPDGLRVLCETSASMPAKRRLLIMGQAGNRGDEAIRDLARVAFAVIPFDHVVVKEMPMLLRGRAFGEISAILVSELRGLGIPDEAISVAPTETDAVRLALAWANAGDLIVCPTHVDKAGVEALLQRLSEMRWTAGQPLPPETPAA
ncbi:MAG: hypothetical protein JWM95_470 [Gemmatimonadetes bacterium]|nr:hypothetical protein [Gemmatimonadota bacterium]